MHAAIYDDYIHNNAALHRRIHNDSSIHSWTLISASDIRGGYLEKANPDVFIMPGGADLYYCDKLNGSGNRRIHNYVDNGGVYLGICAGAYYACQSLSWRKGTDQEISGKRELNFVDACAVGPIKEFTQGAENQDYKTYDIVDITLQGQYHVPVLYWGGPLFQGVEHDRDVDVLCRFAGLKDTPPAMIEKPVGKGRVILSSVHFEYTSRDIGDMSCNVSENDFYLDQDKYEYLRAGEENLSKLWAALWAKLGTYRQAA